MGNPPGRGAAAHYVAQGRQAILELLTKEHAVIWPEVEAKIADQPWPTLPNRVEPHHLTTARRDLIRRGIIEEIVAVTRGAGEETVLALTDRTGRKRAFADAAARKRLLSARYHGWGRASPGHPNVIGVAGERVTHSSLIAAAPTGYLLIRPQGGEVTSLFGRRVPGGPLDDAAHLTILDATGRPASTLTVLVEVKNVRHWIYPSSAELYDLLDKAARLQIETPGHPFVPLLVCRRASFTTFEMAKQLGFFVAPTNQQFILPIAEVDQGLLREVCDELGFDFVRSEDAYGPLTRRFEKALPAVALRTAERFARTAPHLAKHFELLRSDRLRGAARSLALNRLRAAARQLPDYQGGW